jgi:hypothetical protein
MSEANPNPNPKTSIVCTCLVKSDKLIVIESFIAYHLASGFDHIFLCVDSEILGAEFFAWLIAAYGEQYLSIIRPQEGERLQQEHCAASYQQAEHVRKREVQVRQLLNAEMCTVLAAKKGLRWILHIDMDELFYCGPLANSSAVPLHFASLEAQDVGALTYANHEAVPEAIDCDDYYQELTLFRRHHFQLQLGSATAAGMEYWTQRTTYNQYFLLYDCGKSAARTDVGAMPSSVHHFTVPGAGAGAGAGGDRLRARTSLIDPRHLSLDSVLRLQDAYPCVLHYGNAGISWLRDKYCILGDFPDHWKMLYGADLPIAPSFHLECRDVVQKGFPYQVQELFEKQVLFPASDGAELRRQLESGVLMRIDRPALFLAHAQSLFYTNVTEAALDKNSSGQARVARLREMMDLSATAATKQALAQPGASNTPAPVPVPVPVPAHVFSNPSVRAPPPAAAVPAPAVSESDRLRLISQAALQFL